MLCLLFTLTNLTSIEKAVDLPGFSTIAREPACVWSTSIDLLKVVAVELLPNLRGLVLGSIEADFCKEILNTCWNGGLKALDEIYQIYMRPLGEKNRD